MPCEGVPALRSAAACKKAAVRDRSKWVRFDRSPARTQRARSLNRGL